MKPSTKKNSPPEFSAVRPTNFTVFLRNWIPWQILRFLVINLKMTVMIAKSHDTHLPIQKNSNVPNSLAINGTLGGAINETIDRTFAAGNENLPLSKISNPKESDKKPA